MGMLACRRSSVSGSASELSGINFCVPQLAKQSR